MADALISAISHASANILLRSNPDFCGWLRKINNAGKSQRRYCIVIGGNFMYFQNEEADKAKGVFSIHGYRAYKIFDTGYSTTFVLRHYNPCRRSYVFIASSEREQEEWIKTINDVIRKRFPDTIKIKPVDDIEDRKDSLPITFCFTEDERYVRVRSRGKLTADFTGPVQSSKISKPPPLPKRNIKRPSLKLVPTFPEKFLEELNSINDIRYVAAPTLKQENENSDEHLYDFIATDVDETRNQLEKNLNISHYPQNKDTINESPLFGSSSAEGFSYEEEDESDDDDDTESDYSWRGLVDNRSFYEVMSQSNTHSQANMGNQQEDLVLYERMQSVEAIQKQENQDYIYDVPNPSIYKVPNNLPVKSSRILNSNIKALTLPVNPSKKSFLEMKSSTLPLIKKLPPAPPTRATSMAQLMKEQVVSDNELLPISAYYKDMEKHEGSKILRDVGVLGTYIIRSRIEGGVQKDSLSVLVNRTTGETKHYRIFRKNNNLLFLAREPEPQFERIEDLIRHYMKNPLPTCTIKLTRPYK